LVLPPELVIKGVVTDAETGEPVAGAKVFDDGYGPEPDWNIIQPDERSEWGAVTNSAGEYSFLTWPEHHGIKSEAQGYKAKRESLYSGHFTLNKKDEEIFDFALTRLGGSDTKEWMQNLVEDFFKHNYRDITARRTIEWGEPAVDAEGNMSIRYKYEATIWDKDKIIGNKVWTFDKQGKFLYVRRVGAEDIYSLAGAKALVEDFFANNYRDITSKETIEWGQPVKQENGNVSIRYKYEATIWGKDKIIDNKIFTFDKVGKFVSVKNVKGFPQKLDNESIGIEDNDGFKASLTGGVTVELVSVSNYPDNTVCWRPDGSQSKETLFVKVEENKRQDNIGFVAKISGPDDMSISYGPVGVASGHSGHDRVIGKSGEALDGYASLKASITDGREFTSVTFGISTNPWQTVATHTGRGDTTTGSKMIIFSRAFETKDSVGITVSTKQDKARAERIVAIGKDGQIHTGRDWSRLASNDLQQLTVEFHDLRLKDISEFAFQTRPYEWVEFKNVSLKLNFKTDVEIEVKKSAVQVGGEKATAKHKSNISDEVVYKQLEEIVELSELNTEMAFAEAIEEIKHSVDPPLNIVVMWRVLFNDADIDQTTPINIDAMPAIRLGMALRLLLDSVSGFADLGFVVRDGVITISTKESLPAILETRVYDISELVSKEEEADDIALLVTSTVASDNWYEAGGEGTVYTYQDKKLVVSQTYEVHREIQKLLQGLQTSPDMADEVEPIRRKNSEAASKNPRELQLRSESREKLKQLGGMFYMYASDHEKKYPNNLKELRLYGRSDIFNWVLENVRYVGQDKSILINPRAVIAYDKAMLLEKGETNILFNDGHVAFYDEEEINNIEFRDIGIINYEKRTSSADRLSRLGTALLFFANDHDDKYPANLNGLLNEQIVLDEDDLALLAQNIEYLGGKVKPLDGPDAILAYDKTLLMQEDSQGTTVLYNDSRVTFEYPKSLKRLGIKTESSVGHVEGFKRQLEGPVTVHIDNSPGNDRLSIQYAVMAICKAAGVPYQWEKSAELADQQQRQYTEPVHIKDIPAKDVLADILGPVGLSYGLDEDGLYLYKAESETKKAVKVGKADKLASEDLTAEGWALWRQRKLAEAEKKFKLAAKKDPTNDGAYQGLGWAQLNQGKKLNAKKSFEKCVDINPKNSAALNGLGWIAHGRGNKDEAIGWWEKAVTAQPGATASLSGLTQVYMERKQYDEAIKYYNMWLAVEPGNSQAKAGLKEAQLLKDSE
jgi:prepilin-type processing-associated H-X9-DG protein